VRVTVNGEPRDLPESITVAELVGQLGLNQRRIAVEVNRDILPRERYAAHLLSDGDAIEIVHFIGGG
jgi:thiamine biosynthesis protein ThiS